MSTSAYDLVVIGAGSGGLAGAKRAASYGARVAIVESDRVGGTCVIRGCIPKKLMVYAAEFADAFEDAAGYGWSVSAPAHDWASLVRARDESVARLERLHETYLERAGVELVWGKAELLSASRVRVDGRTLETGHVLIAAGAKPVYPTIPGIELAVSSDGFFELAARPGRAALIGGGYIAVELAGILHGLGVEVTLLVRKRLPLRGFDEDLRRTLLEAMVQGGIDVRTERTVALIEAVGKGLRVRAKGPDGDETIEIDRAMVSATGRLPNTDGLGLERAGVALGDDGEVITDEDANTSVPGIFAVGDVTDRFPLTPVAIQAARLLADRIFGGKSARMSYENIPTAVFSSPPIGTVGLGEEEAKARYGDDGVRVYKSRFTPLLHNLTERKVPALVKLIVRASDDRVVGCHVIGHHAPEIIQGFAVAVTAGATKAQFDATVGIHPSSAEELVTLT